MQEVGPDQLVYIDETGIDEREQYAYGWSLQGERCHAQRHGGRGHRLSLISAVRDSAPTRLIEPYVFSGHCERSWIEVWYQAKKVYIRHVLSYKEYDLGKWTEG